MSIAPRFNIVPNIATHKPFKFFFLIIKKETIANIPPKNETKDISSGKLGIIKPPYKCITGIETIVITPIIKERIAVLLYIFIL